MVVAAAPRPFAAFALAAVEVLNARERASGIDGLEEKPFEGEGVSRARVGDGIEESHDRWDVVHERLAVTGSAHYEQRSELARAQQAEVLDREPVASADQRDARAERRGRRIREPLLERLGAIRQPDAASADCPPDERRTAGGAEVVAQRTHDEAGFPLREQLLRGRRCGDIRPHRVGRRTDACEVTAQVLKCDRGRRAQLDPLDVAPIAETGNEPPDELLRRRRPRARTHRLAGGDLERRPAAKRPGPARRRGERRITRPRVRRRWKLGRNPNRRVR